MCVYNGRAVGSGKKKTSAEDIATLRYSWRAGFMTAFEFTAFQVAVLAISSEIFTTKGSHKGLHAKKRCKTHTHRQTER